MTVKYPEKDKVVEEFRINGSDTGSVPVQVALLTQRIRHLTEHLKKFKKDHATRRGLLKLVGRRSAMLRYYARRKPAEYKKLIERLGIRR